MDELFSFIHASGFWLGLSVEMISALNGRQPHRWDLGVCNKMVTDPSLIMCGWGGGGGEQQMETESF